MLLLYLLKKLSMSNLHTKIQEIKRRAAPINYNAVSVNEFGELQERINLLDLRIIEGYAVIWDKPNEYREKFIKGSFSKSIKERGPGSGANYEIKFLYQHSQGDPLSLFEELREDEIGLYFRTKPLDDVPSADRVIKQIRSGTLNNFSQGFDYVWDRMEYDEKEDVIIMKEARLFEISVVAIPADMNTYTIRSLDQLEDLYEDTKDFIDSLPSKFKDKASEIITRHKSLVNLTPLEERLKAPKEDAPVEKGIDYKYLIQNFKL